ncbi:MAG: transcriptional regulator [Gemmatimonadetes bacterium]|nr:transcriptional regulator [Gemmatimonadota bacterium]
MPTKNNALLHRLDIRHLRYFVAVAEELHFGHAAARLNMAQPPLSQQIQQLEGLLGARLLERRPQVLLTPAGREMLDVARRILGQLDVGVGSVLEVASGGAGMVTIGFAASTLLTPLTHAIRKFRQVYPGVTVHLRELSTAEQEDALRARTIDVGVLRQLPAMLPDFDCEALLQERFVVALPPGHRLGTRKSIRVAALAGEPFVHFPPDVAPGLHAEVQRIFESAGVRPPIVQSAREWITIVGLVEAGLGVSIVPESFTRLRWGRVTYRPLAGAHQRTTIALCWDAGRAAPTAAAFVRVVKEAFRAAT